MSLPRMLVHEFPLQTVEVSYGGDRDEYKPKKVEPEDIEEMKPEWAELVRQLQDRLFAHMLKKTGIGQSSSSLCVQDLGISLLDENESPFVLIGSLSDDSRDLDIRTFERALDEFGVDHVKAKPSERLEGGDIVAIGRRLFVRDGGRTNRQGIAFLQEHAEPRGYEVIPVKVKEPEPIHLTTAATWAGKNREGRDGVVLNPAWVSPDVFDEHGIEVVEVSDDDDFERLAANVLPIGKELFVQADCPKLRARLTEAGFENLVEVPWHSLSREKIGFTCVCFVFNHLAQVS